MTNVIDLAKPENVISGLILDKALYLHRHFGPGLLETAYEEALVYLLEKENLKVERQKTIPVTIDGLSISAGFRADLIVENSVICEIKSVEKLAPVHYAQLLTYLKFSKMKVGLLINFGEKTLKDGIKRIVL